MGKSHGGSPAPVNNPVYDSSGKRIDDLYNLQNGTPRTIYNQNASDLNSNFSLINNSLGQQEEGGQLNRNNSQLYHDYVTNSAFNSELGRDPNDAEYAKYHGNDIADVRGLIGGMADERDINSLGQSQFDANNQFITQDAATRATGRDKLAELLTQRARDSFARTLPDIAENSQAAHLYDTTGYGQEVARQQSALGQDIASHLGEVGLNDINLTSQRGAAGLDALHQQQQSGLSRRLSVQDYINQTRRAKLLGQQAAPQVNGKAGQTGATLSGAGAGATAGSAFGPWGTAIGGAAGGAAGYFGSR